MDHKPTLHGATVPAFSNGASTAVARCANRCPFPAETKRQAITSPDHPIQPKTEDSNYKRKWLPLVWLFAPGIPYLLNKLLLVFRERIVPLEFTSIVFITLAVGWCGFALLWMLWISSADETRFIKACTMFVLVAIFVAAIILNFQASIGTIGNVRVP